MHSNKPTSCVLHELVHVSVHSNVFQEGEPAAGSSELRKGGGIPEQQGVW